ncbi:L,D-transpeptidase [Lentisphaerota bacterium ZTH]|nr:L,D-transpeptidase [Lentisphaerota bacterium]WET07502.1 L,D-transpeptidase [Lentisphaerota bacterium ZTH]
MRKLILLLMLLAFSIGCYSAVGGSADKYKIVISIKKQKLYLLDKNDDVLKSYRISSSKYGIGNKYGSNKTPIGEHVIAKKIGAHAPLGTIFKGRVNTHKVSQVYTQRTVVKGDLVLTRIMWLKGLEDKVNNNSFKRYIYIHGTPEEGLIGERASHGCIRMKNKDIIELFNMVSVGTLVYIKYEDIAAKLS